MQMTDSYALHRCGRNRESGQCGHTLAPKLWAFISSGLCSAMCAAPCCRSLSVGQASLTHILSAAWHKPCTRCRSLTCRCCKSSSHCNPAAGRTRFCMSLETRWKRCRGGCHHTPGCPLIGSRHCWIGGAMRPAPCSAPAGLKAALLRLQARLRASRDTEYGTMRTACDDWL